VVDNRLVVDSSILLLRIHLNRTSEESHRENLDGAVRPRMEPSALTHAGR
jgi:hypothetical protein